MGGCSTGGMSSAGLDSPPSLHSPSALTPEARSSGAFARAPSKGSYGCASPFGGVELDDDIWEVRFNFLGEENIERTLSKSDITVLNLLAMIEGHGYGIRDSMYFVKERGKGQQGMQLIDSMGKIKEMIALYEADQVLNITVLKKKAVWPTDLNIEKSEAEVMDVPIKFAADTQGITYISDSDDEQDVFVIGTQQSCNLKRKQPVTVEVVSDGSDEDSFFDPCQYEPEEHNIKVQEEVELIQKLKRQKKERAPDPEDARIIEILEQQKKQRDDPFLHFEGDTDVEEIYEAEEMENSEADEEPEPEYFAKKPPMRQGPTSRSHHEVEEEKFIEFVPSNDEDSSPDELGESDDDGYVKKLALKSGNKRRLKKLKKRIWYDPNRADPHLQFCIKLCFKNVYEFRVALRNFHVAQLRNFGYWRNNADRIIVRCTDEGVAKGCRFFLTASASGEPTTTRVGRKSKKTPRMQGYLNAGKWSSKKNRKDAFL